MLSILRNNWMLKIPEERQSYIKSVLYEINHISDELSQKSLSRKQFHNAMQQKLVNLANSFNLKGLSEYRVNNIPANKKYALIDVVWLADLKPISVFEIDSSMRIKSIKKLVAFEVPFRFWVYYGSKGLSSLIYKHDPDNLIQVTQLHGISLKRERKL